MHLWNPVALVRWNAHKRYLLDLEARGVAIVPTVLVERGEAVSLEDLLRQRGWPEAVVKPAVSINAHGTFRAVAGEGEDRFQALVARADALVQPFVPEVLEEGEHSFVFLGETLALTVLKRAAPGDFRVQKDHGGSATRVFPGAGLEARARAVVDAIEGPWLYARVDAVRRGDELLVMELEAIEPELLPAPRRRGSGPVRARSRGSPSSKVRPMISAAEAPLRWILLPLFALLVSGCPGGNPQPPVAPSLPAEAPATERIVRLPGSDVRAGLYPANCPTVGEGAYVRQVFEGLVQFDESLKVVPALAESWKIADDLETYTFALRKGLTFHDGAVLDASAVVRSFEHYARSSGDWFWVVDPILGARAFRDGKAAHLDGVRALDPLTVEFRLERPDGIFLVYLAMPQGAIYKGATGKTEFPYCGAGPWRNLRVGPRGVEIGPFAVYHGGSPAKIDRLIDDDGRAGEGDLDLWASTPHAKEALVGSGAAGVNATFELRTYPGLDTTYAAFAPGVPLPVRKLVNRVLDRDAYCKNTLDGLAEPSHGVIPPGIHGARPEPRRFDEGEMPVVAEKYTLNASLDPTLFLVLEKALAPHGVVLVANPKKPWQLEQSGWIADYPDPDDYLRILFHSKKRGPEPRALRKPRGGRTPREGARHVGGPRGRGTPRPLPEARGPDRRRRAVAVPLAQEELHCGQEEAPRPAPLPARRAGRAHARADDAVPGRVTL